MDKLVRRLLLWGIMGFIAQFVDGTLGMGYGATLASLLIASGTLPAIASGSVHTAEIVTSLVSGGSHIWFGNIKKEWLLPLVIPGVIGGIVVLIEPKTPNFENSFILGSFSSHFFTKSYSNPSKPKIRSFILVFTK